ncbi:MAG: hypothetical protein LC541_17180 [Candidatus Thiodiazotropha sp.]|nr:hypothetical protein [Candidatus Thiodiazotropha sp.]
MPPMPPMPPMPDMPLMPPMPPMPPMPDMPYIPAEAKGATARADAKPKACITPFNLGIRIFFMVLNSNVDLVIWSQVETSFRLSCL